MRRRFRNHLPPRRPLAFEALESREVLAADTGSDWWSEAWQASVDDWSWYADEAWGIDAGDRASAVDGNVGVEPSPSDSIGSAADAGGLDEPTVETPSNDDEPLQESDWAAFQQPGDTTGNENEPEVNPDAVGPVVAAVVVVGDETAVEAATAIVVPPVVDEVVPVADEIAPVAEEIAPVADEVAPVADEVAPVADEVAPVLDEVVPVVDEVAPVADEVVPVVDEVVPVVGPDVGDASAVGGGSRDEGGVEPPAEEPVLVAPVTDATDLAAAAGDPTVVVAPPESVLAPVSSGSRPATSHVVGRPLAARGIFAFPGFAPTVGDDDATDGLPGKGRSRLRLPFRLVA